MIIGVAMHNIILGVSNCVYFVLYHFEFDFIERYKSNDLKWPWYEDPENWRDLCFNSIFVLIFNGNVMIPAILILMEWLGLTDEH